MRTALIPPVPDLRRTPHSGIHLVLSHLLEDPFYYSFYQERRLMGDYIILDNGAHELGVGQGNELLLSRAARICANEIVLPDVLFDRRGTIEKTKRMLKWLISPEGWEMYCSVGKPRCMLVPQGSERSEWYQCLRGLFNVWNAFADVRQEVESPVIGISKDYDEWRGGLHYLIGHYVEPYLEKYEFDVHCLGWPRDLWSLAKVARTYEWVRSTDSAKPFVYAKRGILLEPGGCVPQYPKRDPSYFNESLSRAAWEVAQRNVLVFQAAAEDKIVESAYAETGD